MFEVDSLFRVVFYRDPEYALKGGQGRLVDGLVESQKKILLLINNNPHIAKQEMAKKIGISTTAIDKNIDVLKKKGLLKRVGSARNGHWEITKK
ncbi:MAG: winged helix-turn-helix transcriptional regulator [Gammaproteobacteria bacterium]|nr:winged helix-turn-helix transcriptional regulator [Gammaproteobacteria bacterium]